jgi:hypothetical protein
MQIEGFFDYRIDEVEIVSRYGEKERFIGMGDFILHIHYVKEDGHDVYWDVEGVYDSLRVHIDGGTGDHVGAMIVRHLKWLATGYEKERIDAEVSARLPHHDDNEEHRLTVRELV